MQAAGRHLLSIGWTQLLVLGLSACGGTDGPPLARDQATPEDTGPVRPTDCSADDAYETLLIDDFERGATTNAFTNNEVCAGCQGLTGDDLASCQADCRQSQTPTDLDKPLKTEEIPDGRCGSRYALHVTTEQFYEWGGLVGFPFSPGIDASGYAGIAFWGRVAWGARSTVRGAAVDPETDATFVDPTTGGPLCDPESTLDDFHDACDPYGAYAVMTGDWEYFVLPFSEMRQRGFGDRTTYLDLGAIRQVSIEYEFGAWDFWIDDLSFYRLKEAP